jgi:ABC-type polysaccharide/polyol phosphate transport system ATPase subunit
MRARLGFSVAVHVDPEILVVDEVLVVGDAAFRQRCADKMRELFLRGATVIMVQHNMDVIVEMCQRVMWLEKGHVQTIGEPLDVVNRYLTSRNLPALEEKPPAPNSGRISGG